MKQAEIVAQASSLLKRLKGKPNGSEEPLMPRDFIGTVAIAQLVHHCRIPSSLWETPSLADLFKRLPSDSLTVDDTPFAHTLTKISTYINTGAGCIPLLQREIKNGLLAEYSDLMSESCLLGWIHQIMIKDRSRSLRHDGQVPQQNLGAATQWFTPEWICEFLVDETLSDEFRGEMGHTFLDPSCGAGHVLVAALRALARQEQCKAKDHKGPVSNSSDSELRLANALNSIYGLDIDPLMIELSGFALYLESRKLLSANINFQPPKLYTWGTEYNTNELGTLQLGAKQNQHDSPLFSPLDGSAITAKDLPKHFTCIAGNPPYLGHRMMPARLSSYLKQHYPAAQYDLYAAFLTLAERLTQEGGRFAFVCQQSFLSIQRYAKLRTELECSCNLSAVASLGAGAFAAKAGEKSNNAIVVFEKIDGAAKSGAQLHDKSSSLRYWPLLDAEDKLTAEVKGLKHLSPSMIEKSAKSSFATGKATMWCAPEIMRIFEEFPPLQSESTSITCVNGLFTCDNKRFVKHYSEVMESDRGEYVPYDKGGGHKWFRTTPYLLHWRHDGEEIRNFRKSRGQSASLPGENFYFKEGVTYSYIGTKGFKARLLSPSSVFDIASSAIFSEKIDNMYLVAFLNSALSCYMLGAMNPTINFQIGDLRRLPFAHSSQPRTSLLCELAAEAVALAREAEQLDPQSPMFCGNLFDALNRTEVSSDAALYASANATVSGPVLPPSNNSPLLNAVAKGQWDKGAKVNNGGIHELYVKRLNEINRREQMIQSTIDDEIFDLYCVAEATRSTVLTDPWVVRSRVPLCKPMTMKQFSDYMTRA